jgi:hypothetical protein
LPCGGGAWPARVSSPCVIIAGEKKRAEARFSKLNET